MNKKKLAALALSGTLLMGGAGFGAYSWFTSSQTVDPNLAISTGTLEVKALDGNEWKAMGDKSQADVNAGVVTNAQPGDNFFKLVTVKNIGSLDEIVNVNANTEVEDAYKGLVNVTVGEDTTGTASPTLQNIKIPVGKEMTLRIVVGLDGEKMGNDWNKTNEVIHLNKILKNKLVTIDATQTNAPSVPEPHQAK